MKQGAFDYLVKPVEKEKLIEVITKAASQRNISGGSNMIA
jgi:FixJ family two-component response regulator